MLSSSDPQKTGMILIHIGVVRGTNKNGKSVKAMEDHYHEGIIQKIREKYEQKKGIEKVEIKINSGRLKVGDKIMVVAISGRYRDEVIKALEGLLKELKNNIEEKEILA